MVRQALKAGSKAAKKITKAAPPTCIAPIQEVPLGTSGITVGTVVKWAIKSLYVDEALPRGPLLQWLLQMLLGVKLCHKELRTIIEAEEGVRIEPLNSRKLNFHAVLDEDPVGFTGFAGDEDVIEDLTEDLWAEAAICLSQGGWPAAADTTHKYYVVASWLQDVSEKFRAWSFGRVMVVVRFAAQADCLLGHRGGLLVPYEESEEYERRENACTGLPTHVQDGESYVENWSELKDCLHELLRWHWGNGKSEVLEVSKLKIMFREVLKRELSETVFGHQCLSRLLADERLNDEFSLETCQGNRYMLRANVGVNLSNDDIPSRSSRSDEEHPPANSKIAPPPGLSFEGDPKPPPGLSLPDSNPVEHLDLASWPTPADALNGESPALSAAAISRSSKLGSPKKQAGLSPEKTMKKPSSEHPPQKKAPDKVRTVI